MIKKEQSIRHKSALNTWRLVAMPWCWASLATLSTLLAVSSICKALTLPWVAPPATTYKGPLSVHDDMMASEDLPGMGMKVLVGPSKTVPGLGLFVALKEDQKQTVKITRGTPICDYHPGAFTNDPCGDKTVAFSLASPAAGVIFHNQIMSLSTVVAPYAKNCQLDPKSILAGHCIAYDKSTDCIHVIPNEEDGNFPRYFVPDMNTVYLGVGEARMGLGVFANDLAFEEGVTLDEESYITRSLERNILSLIWRIEENKLRKRMDEAVFLPSWPVVIVNQDVHFKNSVPMEVGMVMKLL